MMGEDIIALVVADTLGDIIVDQLELILVAPRSDAVQRANELICALSEWAREQGASEVSKALDQLQERVSGDAVEDNRFRPKLGFH
jgi:hypothetical protein